jgi:hypothetical protein
MILSRIQKISIAFFICSLLPSYLIAQWRHEANSVAISNEFAQEKNLHLSADKLLLNCERNEKKDNDHYSANHQICEQGLQEHELTTHAMDGLRQDKVRNETRWYRNFFLSVLLFNLLAVVVYKGIAFLRRDDN